MRGVVESAERAGFRVRTVSSSPDGALGWYVASERAISIVEASSAGTKVATMLHELAHACDIDARQAEPRAVRELVAESAAYLVGTSALGLPMEAAAVFYTMSWGADAATMKHLACRALATANRVELIVADAHPALRDE